MVIGKRRTVACLISETQTTTKICWFQIAYIGNSFFLFCYICLFFNLKVKSRSPVINMCIFLCIECRMNDSFCSYFKRQKMWV